MPSGYHIEYSPIRAVSVSSDTRYISVAGKVGFAHLSTSSARWRILDLSDETSSEPPEGQQNIPHTRGGMCWYGGILLIGADFGDTHEVNPFENGAHYSGQTLPSE